MWRTDRQEASVQTREDETEIGIGIGTGMGCDVMRMMRSWEPQRGDEVMEQGRKVRLNARGTHERRRKEGKNNSVVTPRPKISKWQEATPGYCTRRW